MFLSAMVTRGAIQVNPFKGVKGVHAVIDESRDVYVPQADVYAVMEEAPDAEWRAMIALSRFGGLRLPSEVLSLGWEYVNWNKETDHYRQSQDSASSRRCSAKDSAVPRVGATVDGGIRPSSLRRRVRSHSPPVASRLARGVAQ